MKAIEVDGRKAFPSKVICVGRNYTGHIEELGSEVPEQMVLFFKPNTAITDKLVSFHEEVLHYEAEIALVVRGREYCAVGFALDLTKRDLQSRLKAKGLPWERSKAFDGAAVFSPFVAIGDSIENLALELWVDGMLRQKGGVADMLHKPDSILKEVDAFASLEDFDVVMTGTPKGVGPVVPDSEYVGIIKSSGSEILRHAWRAR